MLAFKFGNGIAVINKYKQASRNASHMAKIDDPLYAEVATIFDRTASICRVLPSNDICSKYKNFSLTVPSAAQEINE